VTLSLATASAGIVGNSTILDMTIVPGNNSFPMTAIIDQTKVISSMDSQGFVNMIITGTSAVYNGQHITYYEEALASNVLTLKMNVEQILADSTGL
jgi:UDP-glucose 4-epimerase